MPRPRLLPQRLTELPPVADNAPPLKDDLIYGVEAIRDELNLRNAKQVYHLHKRSNAPIFMMEGIGLCARRSGLRAWIARKETAALSRGASGPELAKPGPAS